MPPENAGYEKWLPLLREQDRRGTIAIYKLRYVLTGIYVLIAALAAFSGDQWNEILGRQDPAAPLAAPGIPSRDSLVATFWEERKLMFVYGSQDEAAAEQYRKILQNGTERWDYLEVAIRRDTEVDAGELDDWAVFLIGTPEGNSLLPRIMQGLPFSIAGDSLVFNGKSYHQDAVLALSFYPRPNAPGKSISVFSGPSDGPVLEFLARQHWRWFSFAGWAYQVYLDGDRRVMGYFDQRPGHEWEIGGELHWDYSDPPREYGQFGNLRMLLHDPGIPARVLDSAGQALQATMEKAIAFLGSKRKAPALDFHIYATSENKGLQTGNTRQVHTDGTNVLQALSPEFQGFASAEPLRPLLRNTLQAPESVSMETGLAVYLTDHWQDRGWKYWAAWLHRSGNGLPMEELLDNELMASESPLVSGCMAAAMVAFLLEEFGKEEFLLGYVDFALENARKKSLQKRFAAWLDRLVAEQQNKFPARRTLAQAMPAYQKGFNFAHEGYQIYNGYISSSATRSLAYTAEELHCNVTAIVPYTGMGDPNTPAPFGIADGAGTENDESVVHCLWGARRAGLHSLLKPQVWLQKGWPGAVEMSSDQQWELFFGYYYRWMRHYALLSEMYGADALCLGVEFQEATLKRPDDWRAMIKRLKGIFSGPVTYAANWGKEFEGLSFWDELDFIGLNCYYPLSTKDNADQKELDRGFEQVMDKVEKVARKWDKQVVFTEIGFPSIAEAWKEPHAEPDDRPASVEDQASCYSAMIRALKGREWCGGVYLWKWPAHPRSDGSRELARGFAPKGKPAEDMVRKWFEGI